MNKITKKIIKICGLPEDFIFDYVSGATIEEGIRRMKEYVACVRKVERNKKVPQHR